MDDQSDSKDNLDEQPPNNLLASSEQPAEVLESSHIERVSSFVRKHRNSFSQNKQTWISSSSLLPFKDRKSQINNSFCSSNSTGPPILENLEVESPENSDIVPDESPANKTDDAARIPPEEYGKLLYEGKVEMDQAKIISLLGKKYFSLLIKSDLYHISLLKSYVCQFDFSEMDIDDAFRKVCQKIDILGETQVIDRILFQISQRYWDCNEKLRDVFLSVDITYGILFSLVLLNTDLNIANVGAKDNNKMTKKDFLKNTTDLVISMIENDADLKEFSKSDNKKKEWKKNLQSLLQNYYTSIRNKGFVNSRTAALDLGSIKPIYSMSRNDSTWSMSSGISVSSFFSNASSSSLRPFSGFKGFFRRSLRQSKSTEGPIVEDELAKDKIYEGLVIRKHLTEKFDIKAKNRRWFKCKLILKMNESEVKLIMMPYDSKKNQKSGLSLPPSGPSAYQLKLTSGGPETFDLLHSTAEPLRHLSYSIKRPHVFLLSLGNGASYLFQVPSLECKEAWTYHINYCAASKSKEPLRDVLSSIDYGWNKIEWAIKKAQIEQKKVDFHQMTPYSAADLKLQIWERSIHNIKNSLVSNADTDTQIRNFEKQLSIITTELDLHKEYKDAVEILYPDCSAKKLALANLANKESYLDSELKKYNIYIEALISSKTKLLTGMGVSSSLHSVLESDT